MKLKREIIIELLLIFLFLSLVLGYINYIKNKATYREYKDEYHNSTQVLSYDIYNKDYFSYDGQFLKYEDNRYTSSIGIDVSEFQDNIDWKQVKQQGIDFAFIRIGRRGATTNILYGDVDFEKNYEQAKNNGIKVGVYFFSQAITKQDAIQEADFCLELLGDRELDFPIVLDYEQSGIPGARTDGITKETATECALAFLKEIEAKGKKAMIYTYLYWSENKYDLDALKDYDFWFAQYDVDNPQFKIPFSVWQYTDKGIIDGIDGYTDLDIMFIRKNDQSE